MKLTVLIIFLASIASCHAAEFRERSVYTSGQEGYHTFRIPSIVRAVDGTLLAFAEGRVNNLRDHDDVDLVLKRSHDNGATWGPLQVLWGQNDGGVITWGNPCTVVDESNGRIWLMCNWEVYEIYVMFSDDHGASWTRPKNITKEAWNPEWPRPPAPTNTSLVGPGIGIQLVRGPHAGRLVMPMHLRRHPLKNASENEVSTIYSDNHGATWNYSRNTTGVGNEAQVVELSDGRLMMNQRNQLPKQNPRYRLISYSRDGGETWTRSVADAHLVGPVVQASILRYAWEGGRGDMGILLFSMPAGPGREGLTVHISTDDGASWPEQRTVCESDSAYSCLVRQEDGRIGLLYEAGYYKTIQYASFDLDWIKEGGRAETTAFPGVQQR